MTTIAVAGLAGVNGASVIASLEADPAIERIVGIDPGEPARPGTKLEFHKSPLVSDRVTKIVAGADALVC
ncbi:MAG: epimerase, partial [Actinomycetota bacterium]